MVLLEGQWKSFIFNLLLFVVVMIVGSYETSAAIDDCPLPRCVTYAEINTYWADPNPAFFLQCRPQPNGTWAPQRMACGPGTLFSFKHQVCVLEGNWNATSNCTEIPPASECGAPSCETYDEINTLWVHPQREKFYQCRPAKSGKWEPQEMLCSVGTVFSFFHQVCDYVSKWKEPCWRP
ncbi:uncharacterized protein LOC126556801 [Anopheles maculipalpis]|uniref:uncharacterized protein LOC126556801 n=1 Tax=Anopheles maculipalpis TaxID=1496333 RepID=UPI0021595B31|nr:uncharacterized protein LOC126556801 [Anopheles maculipalpis]